LTKALFAWVISRTFSANEQYFSLTTNQRTILSAIASQANRAHMFFFEYAKYSCIVVTTIEEFNHINDALLSSVLGGQYKANVGWTIIASELKFRYCANGKQSIKV
jgi:hypothetical protein